MENLKVLIAKPNLVLLTQVEEVESELGEPDCKLINPFELFKNSEGKYDLRKWPDFTDQREMKIHSDSIFTILDPTPWQFEMYLKLSK